MLTVYDPNYNTDYDSNSINQIAYLSSLYIGSFLNASNNQENLTLGATSNLILQSKNGIQMYINSNDSLSLYGTAPDGTNPFLIFRIGMSNNKIIINGSNLSSFVSTGGNTYIYPCHVSCTNNDFYVSSNIFINKNIACSGNIFSSTVNIFTESPNSNVSSNITRVGYSFHVNKYNQLELLRSDQFNSNNKKVSKIQRVATFGNTEFGLEKDNPNNYTIMSDFTGIEKSNYCNHAGSCSNMIQSNISQQVWSSILGTNNIYYTNGLVGIGTSNPLSKLHVDGVFTTEGDIIPRFNMAYNLGSCCKRFKDVYLSGNIVFLNGSTLSVNNTGNLIFTNSTGIQTALGSYNTSLSNIYLLNCNVGINTTNPSYNLEVNGTFSASTYCNLLLDSYNSTCNNRAPTASNLAVVYNMSQLASNAAYFASNAASAAYFASNAASVGGSAFSSNTAYFASNTAVYGSNAASVAYFASNAASAAYFASNAASVGGSAFSSNTAYFASNAAVYASNAVPAAYFASNAVCGSAFSSNTAVYASNIARNIIPISNVAYYASNAVSGLVFSSNAAVYASNIASSISNTLCEGGSVFSSNAAVYASNTAYYASNVLPSGRQFVVSASNYSFTIDGSSNNPNIWVVPGLTYSFKIESHCYPFQIRASDGGSAITGGMYWVGVSGSATGALANNGRSNGILYWTVPINQTNVVYQSQYYPSMVGNIYIQPFTNGLGGILTDSVSLSNSSIGASALAVKICYDKITSTSNSLGLWNKSNNIFTMQNVSVGKSNAEYELDVSGTIKASNVLATNIPTKVMQGIILIGSSDSQLFTMNASMFGNIYNLYVGPTITGRAFFAHSIVMFDSETNLAVVHTTASNNVCVKACSSNVMVSVSGTIGLTYRWALYKM